MTTRSLPRTFPRLTISLAPVARLLELWRQRDHLARLDDAALRDIGLTRDQVVAETSRPLWDVPSHWMR